jgi:hypothetical protein
MRSSSGAANKTGAAALLLVVRAGLTIARALGPASIASPSQVNPTSETEPLSSAESSKRARTCWARATMPLFGLRSSTKPA